MIIQPRELPAICRLSSSMHPVIRNVYRARGVLDDAEAALRLADLHSPESLLNIRQAVQLVQAAMEQGQSILTVGDFDVDGATSCALVVLCLRAMGHEQVDYLVPNRFDYGYGLTPEIVRVAEQRKPELLLTVDNGIASHEGVELANKLGFKVLVTDHHLPGASLPPAAGILNPNLPDCPFPSKALAGVGVAFYLMLALRTALRERNWFVQRGLPEPNLAHFLDLVALGTVADLVPLDANNRRLVRHGLALMRSGRGRPGIAALLAAAGKDRRRAMARDLAFSVAPRLNAAGRLKDMSLGIECLLAEEADDAGKMAERLNEMNSSRRGIEKEMRKQAMDALATACPQVHGQVNPDGGKGQLGICLYDENWHQGVIGILAARLKDEFHRPCIIFADADQEEEGEAMIKGSVRSIPGLHIRDLLNAVAVGHPGLLRRFGGHAMAAGLTIRRDDFKTFAAAFGEQLEAALDEHILRKQVLTDGSLPADCFTLTFAEELQAAGPWGQHFPEPLFTGRFSVLKSRVLKDRHLKLILQIPDSEDCIDAVIFNAAEELLAAKISAIELLYRLDVNEYLGIRTPRLAIEHVIDYWESLKTPVSTMKTVSASVP